MYNSPKIINAAIKSIGASDRFTTANMDNLSQIGTELFSTNKDLLNDFLDTIVNKIAHSEIISRQYKNPLSKLKSGQLPLGNIVEDIFVNPACAEEYLMSSEKLLKIVEPDVKALYYKVNRQDKYSVTITRAMLQKAFSSNQAFSNFIDYIINSLEDGDNYDEYLIIKNLMINAIKNDRIKKFNLFESKEEYLKASKKEQCEELVFQLKAHSKQFTFKKTDYNKYKEIVDPDGSKNVTPVLTHCPAKNQVLLIDATISARIDVQVLATAFNLSVAEIETMKIEVDDFADTGCVCVLCDEKFFRVFDTNYEKSEFHNPDNLSTKYYLHHWGVYSYSIMANAMSFYLYPKNVSTPPENVATPPERE